MKTKDSFFDIVVYLLIGTIATIAIMAAMVGKADRGLLDLF